MPGNALPRASWVKSKFQYKFNFMHMIGKIQTKGHQFFKCEKYLNYLKQRSNRNKINSRVCLTLVTKTLHKCKNMYSNICIYIIYSNICYNHQMFFNIFAYQDRICDALVTRIWQKTEIIVFQSGGFQSAQLFAFFIIHKVG